MDFKKHLEDVIPRLKPFEVGVDGRLLEWDREVTERDREHRHVSLSDYITDCRMKMAHALIMNTDEPINSIVQKVGYNSPSLFYRKFYEYYRVKPGELPRNGINDDY